MGGRPLPPLRVEAVAGDTAHVAAALGELLASLRPAARGSAARGEAGAEPCARPSTGG